MQKTLFGLTAALLCVALSGCGEKNAAEGDAAATRGKDGPLVLAAMLDAPPYCYKDPETGEARGIDVDIVRAAAARLGRPLEIREMPFSELLHYVQDGKADFAANAITITEGRKRTVDFSNPYSVEGTAFLYRTGEKPPTMITLESAVVGVIESMTQDFYLTRHGIDPRRYASFDEAVADFRAGKLDAVAYDRPAIQELADKSGGKLSVTPLETRENYGIAVRKGCPELLEAVNAVIAERNAK